jgi:hypothetical protein
MPSPAVRSAIRARRRLQYDGAFSAARNEDGWMRVNANDPVSAAHAAAIAACGDAERVAVDPAGRTIAGLDAMRHLRTWDARSGRCLLVHAFDRGRAIALGFDRAGERLAVLLSEGTLVVFERRAHDGLAWLQPARSYSGPADDEYHTKLAFDSGERNVIVTTAADIGCEGAVRIVEVAGVKASDAGRSDANDIAQAETVAAAGSSQGPVRLRVGIPGGQMIVVSRNAGAGTGRISGPGVIAFWNDAGIARFELDFVDGNVRFLAVRTGEPWTLLGTSTLEALGRDGWYALAAALGACYDGKVTAFERGVTFP